MVALERRGRSGILWVVGRSTLTAWSAGRDRVVLGSVGFPHETWLIGAAVKSVGNRVLVADSSGILRSVRAERPDQLETSIWTAGNLDGLIFDGDDAVDGGSPLQIRVDVEHQFDVEFSALTSADPHGCFLGTISGDVVLVGYNATEKYRFNVRTLLGEADALEQIGAFLGREDPTRAVRHDAAVVALDYYAARSLLAVVTREGAALLLVATADTQPTAVRDFRTRVPSSAVAARSPPQHE